MEKDFETTPLSFNLDFVVNREDLTCADTNTLETILSEIGSRPGDFDLDGRVGFSDFLILANSFSQPSTYLTGDMTLDGVTNFADFLQFAPQFEPSPRVNAVALPEPNAFALAAWPLLVVLRNRKRQQPSNLRANE